MSQRRTIPPGQRGRRLASTPLVSVVIASTGPREQLERCLARVIPVVQSRGVELVVCRQCPMAEYQALTDAYPAVLFMPVGDDVPAAQVRGVGLSATEGDVVAVINDDGELDPAWLDTIMTPDRPLEREEQRDWEAWFAHRAVELP